MDCADARPLLSRQLDEALPSRRARSLRAHLATCAPCRAFGRELEAEQRTLGEAWPAVAAPAGFTRQVAASLPPRSAIPSRRPAAIRRLAPAAAVLLVLLTAGLLVSPVRAGLGLVIRNVILRESSPPREPQQVLPLQVLSLEEAQRLAPWRIRLPGDLPDGYRLVRVASGEVHAFAVGPTIVLTYQQGEGAGARFLTIIQLRTATRAEELIAAGSAQQVPVGERTGLLIDGEWVEENGHQRWVQGMLLRLIVEDGDLVIWLEADPRDGWDADRLIAVAASLR